MENIIDDKLANASVSGVFDTPPSPGIFVDENGRQWVRTHNHDYIPAEMVAPSPAAIVSRDWWIDADNKYVVDDDGVWENVLIRKGYVMKQVANYPIMPTAIVKPLDEGGREYVELEYMTSSGVIAHTMVEVGVLSRMAPEDMPGYAAPEGRSKQKLGDTMLKILRSRVKNGEIPIKEGSLRGGWFDHQHLRPGNPNFLGNVVSLSKVKGDREIWANTVREMIADSPLAAVTLAITFGSYARGLIESDISHIWYLHGDGGKGKSTIIRMAASIQGSPLKGEGSPYFEGVSTLVGVENLLAASNHGFLCLDELDDAFKKGDGVERIMYFSNGGGRAKSDRAQQGGVSLGVTWQATIFSSGNTDIHDQASGHSKFSAMCQRVIQAHITDPDLHTFTSVDRIQSWTQTLSENYGFGYTEAIAILSDKEAQRYAIEKGLAYFKGMLDTGFAEDKQRAAKFLTFAYIGCDLIEDILGDDAAEHCTNAVAMLRSRLVGEAAGAASREADVSDFTQWLYSNIMRFRIIGNMAPPSGNTDPAAQQMYAAECTSEAMKRGGAFGVIEQPDVMGGCAEFTGRVFLFKIGRDMAEKAGINMQEVINSAKRERWLIAGEGDHTAKKYNTSNGIGKLLGQGRAYTFDFGRRCPF